MNRRRTFRMIVAVALPLGLLAPSGAPAQAKGEPNPPPAAGSARQDVLNKLDRIRFDAVHYDGLPLSEVVAQLRDEAKKRDPEKAGINILINPNPPALAPSRTVDPAGGTPTPAAAPEVVDVNSILIKITPPLSDVRLVDVLDAAVKVADHPIKYSIEDYGVVFSLRGSEAACADDIPAPPAPASGQTNLGPAASTGRGWRVNGSGRQVVTSKLENIHFDTVHYDGLPLNEVVGMLRDEVKKRDPEKKGINFLINPNPPAPGPEGSPTPEVVDVGAVLVKINPPLTDVRLVDALDAVVKVAERPIQYSVQDYGVVFSLKGPEPAPDEIDFAFPGGTPSQFLAAVQEKYKVDWLSVADIPEEMVDVRIPKLRINRGSLMAVGHGNDVGIASLEAWVILYNRLAEQKPELGRLIVTGDMAKPSVVMFVPNKALGDAPPKLKVKAFSVYGISEAERAKLREAIDAASVDAIQYASRLRGSSGERSLGGTVGIHKETNLLVATGTESFVDMVESIVTACQAKERARNPGAPAALPNPTVK